MKKLLLGFTLLASISSYASTCDELNKLKTNLDLEIQQDSNAAAYNSAQAEAVYLKGESIGEHPLSMESSAVAYETAALIQDNRIEANKKSLLAVEQNLESFCGVVKRNKITLIH